MQVLPEGPLPVNAAGPGNSMAKRIGQQAWPNPSGVLLQMSKKREIQVDITKKPGVHEAFSLELKL